MSSDAVPAGRSPALTYAFAEDWLSDGP